MACGGYYIHPIFNLPRDETAKALALLDATGPRSPHGDCRLLNRAARRRRP